MPRRNPKRSNDGKTFEQVVAAVEQCLGDVPNTRVDRNVQVIDRDGVPQQIDVLVTVPVGGDRCLRVALECRDYASRVKKEAIHSFKKKCEEARIDRAVMVARSGYQSGAIEKAKALGVELLTLGEFDAARAHSLLRIPSVSIVSRRFRLSDAEIHAPTLPMDAPQSEIMVLDNVWRRKLAFSAWLTELVNTEPPPFARFEEGLRLWRTLKFKDGEVDLIWKCKHYPLDLVRIATEFYTENKTALRVASGVYSDLIGDNDKAKVVTYKVPEDPSDIALSFIQTSLGKLNAIAEMPVEYTGRSPDVRVARLTALFNELKFESRHERVGSDGPLDDLARSDASGMRLMNSKLTVRTGPAKEGSVLFARVFLKDRRTSFGTGEFILEVLVRSRPPCVDVPPGLMRRIKSTIKFPEDMCFVDSSHGLLSVAAFDLEAEYFLSATAAKLV